MADIVEVIEVGAQVVEVVQVGPPGPPGTTSFEQLQDRPAVYPPQPHGQTHALGSIDEITAPDIGAAPAVPKTGNMIVSRVGMSQPLISPLFGTFIYAGELPERPFFSRTLFDSQENPFARAQLRYEQHDPATDGQWKLVELTGPDLDQPVLKYTSPLTDAATPDLVQGAWTPVEPSMQAIAVTAQTSAYALHEDLSPVATSGFYSDLTQKPSLTDLVATEGTFAFTLDPAGQTLGQYTSPDALSLSDDKRALLKSLGASPGPVIDRVVPPGRSNAPLFIANGATVGAAVSIAHRTALLAPIAVNEDIHIDAFAVRLSGSGWTQTGPVQMTIYEHGEQGLPSTVALSGSRPPNQLGPLWRSFEIDASTPPNTWITHELDEPIRLPCGFYWMAFLNLSGVTQNLASAGTRNNLLFDLLGANIVITGTAPEGLNFFVPSAEPNLPLFLNSLVFQPNTNTASTSTLRYRVSAPWMGVRYVQAPS
jgi:hypothetical protein